MKLKIVLKTVKNKFGKIKNTPGWQRMFVHKIDEAKMREYQDQHRMMSMRTKGF